MSKVEYFDSETPPKEFDGFGFFRDTLDGIVKFYYFDDMVKAYGPEPKDPNQPDDRECFHVILTSVRKAMVHIEAPFTSNFIDAFVYAKHIAHSGFSGVMIRKSRFSVQLLKDSLLHMMSLHKKNKGFVYCEDGVETFHKGKKSVE